MVVRDEILRPVWNTGLQGKASFFLEISFNFLGFLEVSAREPQKPQHECKCKVNTVVCFTSPFHDISTAKPWRPIL